MAEDMEKNSRKKDIIYFIFCVALGIFLALLLHQVVTQKVEVEGISMVPTLEDGDILLSNKISYKFHSPKRFDIVIFPHGQDENYVKRVIGLPGETVQIIEGYVYINGEKLEDPYYSDPMDYAGTAETPLTLQEGEYFVLGDNRPVSKDSRYEEVGVVREEEIKAKVGLRIQPFSSFGKVK